MNKKIKIIIINVLFGGLFTSGALLGFSKQSNDMKNASALTTQTISEITGFTRVAGQNGKTFIRFAANEVVGDYQISYTGNVFAQDGTVLPLVLYPNGGAGSATWANGGTRQFEFKTDNQEFITAINGGTTFYLTKDSKFSDGTKEISFEKEYVFTSIYDGNCKINEFAPTVCSFDIKEVNNRPESTKIRVGVNNFFGISAGFAGNYAADIIDNKGTSITATISDAGSGSSSAGNRLVNIAISKQTTNIIVIPNGTRFVNSSDLTKVLVLAKGYRLDSTSSANYRVDAVGNASDFATIANNSFSCDSTGVNAPTFIAGYSWDVLKQISLALDADSKNELKNWTSSSNEIVKTFMTKYDYILNKYGTSSYSDFIEVGGYSLNSANYLLANNHQSDVALLTISLSLIAIVSIVALKKKKASK